MKCKDCGEVIHKRGDKYAAEERRPDAPPFTGTERRGVPPPTDPPAPADTPPRREHLLHRKIIGR